MRLPVELQSLVDIYDQPFLIIDDNHRVVVVNEAFEKAYGIGRKEAAGNPCYSLIAQENRPCPCGTQGDNCPFLDTFRQQVTLTSAHSYRDTEGREHLVRIQANPIRTESGKVYLGELIQQDAIRQHPEVDDRGCPGARMVGNAPLFREALERLQIAAGTDAPVLLQGETGTGKELAASYVHRHSARRDGPFQTLDCSVLTEELFESEVFGHERGAFTGSVGDKQGLFELADKGTLFLDEIGEMSQPLQAKLLRVLESGSFRRVGGTRTRSADVRIVCATNRDLQKAPWFRNDLYYRVACMSLVLPSLAQRREDIPLLAMELLERIGRSAGRDFTICDEALRLLQGYDFPGNIRELRNVLWVSAVNSPGGHICEPEVTRALPVPKNGARCGTQLAERPAEARSAKETRPPLPTRKGWEADHLQSVLRRHNGNRRAVAEELGVSERTVYRKLRKLGLN